MLEDASIEILVSEEGVLKDLPGFGGQVVALDRDSEAIGGTAESDREIRGREQRGLCDLHVGVDGPAKGSVISILVCAILLAQIEATLKCKAESHVLQFASLSFDASVWEYSLRIDQGRCTHSERDQYCRGPTVSGS
jgi:non-ribosomal peptide synthetase component F